MTGFGTPYSETEALLYAMEDVETDSDNEFLDAYLAENFLPGELLTLERAADLLSYRCGHVRRNTRRKENHAVDPK